MKNLSFDDAYSALDNATAIIINDCELAFPDLVMLDDGAEDLFLTLGSLKFNISENMHPEVDSQGRLILVSDSSERVTIMPLVAKPITKPVHLY